MSDFKPQRAIHETVMALLAKMSRAELKAAQCYFGGGTRIVLELGEYRVSKDVDFMCSSNAGYKRLRESIADNSLGPIFKNKIVLVREVRADQYGIRTVIEVGQEKIKFEIVREGRIDLMYESISQLPVPCLTRAHSFAEKFLANADRGLDASTLSRDAIDLAYMAQGWTGDAIAKGWIIAVAAYGKDVPRKLKMVVSKLRQDKLYRNKCTDGLGINDTKTMLAGLARLERADWVA